MRKKAANIFDLLSLEAQGKTIKLQIWETRKTRIKMIFYGEDIKIYYCATDFFYWKNLPDFQAKYGKIENVPEQSIYHRVNETKRQKTGEKRSLQGSNLVDDGYYTLSGKGYEEGSIVGQTIAPGQTYDESNPGDEPLKIQVIGTVLDWTGKTGKEFEDELSQMGFTKYYFCNKYRR